MTDAILSDIIASCLKQDRLAESLYIRLSKCFDGDLACFWRDMALEEHEHVAFWEALDGFARQGHLPQVFEEPGEILESLSRGAAEVERLAELSLDCDEVNGAFILCYRLECALMHPAFETLFRFAQDARLPLPLDNPEASYENHIRRFIVAVQRFGDLTPELELLGELLARLWDQTKAFAIQVHTDALTRVLNRRGFFKVIDPLVFLCVRNAQPVGLLMIDLDNFKHVNDAHGHQTGDKVLTSVAEAIRRCLRRSDVVGRYGGEEFIVFLPGCDSPSLSTVAGKIRASVEETSHHGVSITASVGAAHLEQVAGGHEMERLITRADQCLYKAKLGGRNRVFVDCTGEEE